VALITGITGQDGSYLAEFLIDKVPILWIPILTETFWTNYWTRGQIVVQKLHVQAKV
jgi:GDP-D-mannose dehydratase